MKKASLLLLCLATVAAQAQTPPAANTGAPRAAITIKAVKPLPFLSTRDGHDYQSVELTLANSGDPTSVTVHVKGEPDQQLGIDSGSRQLEIFLPEVKKSTTIAFSLLTNGKVVATGKADLQPVRKMTIYVLPHSHNDIGYTEIQTDVERKQMNNLLTGIDYARRTKDYPAGARFVWNLEGVYAADLFLHRMTEQQRQAFIAAVKDGSVALNGMYVNTLTGLCRPEELLQLFHRGSEIAAQCGTTIDAAMISDVPGYTWGTVTAMAQAGIKYLSAAPNFFDRIGDILQAWADKPFYWVSPSGKEKVLVWIPYRGYAYSYDMPHGLTPQLVADYIAELKRVNFNYDISYIRWIGHGDNSVPDLTISEFVKNWTTKYTWPKFIISSTSTAFHAFEEKYGSQLPQAKGDWTGYWEDGAGSSAFETAENRATSSRLSQAEALWVMKGASGPAVDRDHTAFPVDRDRDAWKYAILYSEHTWGADCSVTRPLSQKTMEQWIIKKSYATQADSLSRQLLDSALDQSAAPATNNAIDVFNINSWSRTGLVLLTRDQSQAGDRITDATGHSIPSQRLSTGELAFVATDIPPFAAKRYTITAGSATTTAGPAADTHSLDNGILHLNIDATTGVITSLKNPAIDNEFADTDSSGGLNDYLFLNGNNLKDLQRNGPVKITISEQGPVLAELRIESAAPGVEKLVRKVRLIAGLDYAEITNILDKLPAELDPHPGDYAWANLHGKESLNIGFPFHVPGGEIRLDLPMAIMQPEKDQIPGSCKNWLEVGSWADVSNKDYGVTWVTLDAPLVEVGGITATLLGGQSNPAVWRKHIEPTQKLYSWALNNHWETNYRAYQDGIITFRYALQPHKLFDAAASTKLATALSQPLIAATASVPTAPAPPAAAAAMSGSPMSTSRLQLSSQQLVVLALRPALDGKAWIVSLFNPTQEPVATTLTWNSPVGAAHYSNTTEAALAPVEGSIAVAPQDVVTIRVEK
ncbi:glycoside hydrolase family 38 C-terminal domain-containing protein [Puia dinghuensis]|uniref:Alpha-mannosidase n=1 Tax=Puia dinghuensis TaxID=1792502 RepID=A0A8J2UI80_9BACT|nr:glycoside hydrolase family 38 C-terminal domain-containing protein [Puia dinghuensis]GGB19700.1 alpha-mannosidase [Puia dinghuensis]